MAFAASRVRVSLSRVAPVPSSPVTRETGCCVEHGLAESCLTCSGVQRPELSEGVVGALHGDTTNKQTHTSIFVLRAQLHGTSHGTSVVTIQGGALTTVQCFFCAPPRGVLLLARRRAPAPRARRFQISAARSRVSVVVSTVALYLRKNRACVFNVTTLRFTSTPHTRDAAHAHSTQTTHGTHTHDTVEPDSRETRHTPSQCDQLHLLRACLRAATGYIDLGAGVPAASTGGCPAAR